MSAALRRSFGSLQIPNYRRYFAGQLVSLSGNWMQMVAEMWLVLELTGSGVAVGVTSALQFLPMLLFGAWGGVLADRWPKRSLLIVTQSAMALPALALWALTATRRRRAVDGVRARLRPRRRQLDRQPGPAELRDRDGRRRSGRQRGRPQQRPRSTAARILGPAGAGAPDRDGRRRALLPAQRGHLRRDDRRPAGAWTRRGSRAGADQRDDGDRGGVRAALALRARRAEPADPAGDDGGGRDARVQLPGPAAAARPLHLRRRRRRLHGARGRDGGRLGRRARSPPAPAGGSASGCWSAPRSAFGVFALLAAARPDPAAGDARAGPARRSPASPSPPASTRPCSSARARRCAAG